MSRICVTTCSEVEQSLTYLLQCICWHLRLAGPWYGRVSMGSHLLRTLWGWCICQSCLAHRTPGRSHHDCHGCWPSYVSPLGPVRESYQSLKTLTKVFHFLFYNVCHMWALTVICTANSPSPASLASMVNSTGREAGTPVVLRPGPLARTLLASWVGSTFTL